MKSEVFQGLVPGLGPVMLELRAEQSISGRVFCQENGDGLSFSTLCKSGLDRFPLLSNETEATNGWMTLRWPGNRADLVSGSWQPRNATNAWPIRLNRVASIRTRERHCWLALFTAGYPVVEWTDYPVFPAKQMRSITDSLRAGWWSPPVNGRTSFRELISWARSLTEPSTYEPINTFRDAELLVVSDHLVTVATFEAAEGAPAASARRRIVNFTRDRRGFRKVQLSNLFKPKTPWEERLSRICRNHLHSLLPEEFRPERVDARDMENFAMLPDGLFIRFNPFVSPTEDPPVLLIPWAQLNDLVEPQGPIRCVSKTTTRSS